MRKRSNLEVFSEFVERDPDNSFARYSLAMEYRKLGKPDEAVKHFEELIARDPAYIAAYLMAGQVAVELDEIERAQDMLTRGIEAARNAGNQHAAGEMTILLESLDD